jgi:hypothetical protein
MHQIAERDDVGGVGVQQLRPRGVGPPQRHAEEERHRKGDRGHVVGLHVVHRHAPRAQAFGKADHRGNEQRQDEDDRRQRADAPAERRLQRPPLDREADGKEAEKDGGRNRGREMSADDLVHREERDDQHAAQRLALQEAEREPRQRALVARKVEPARRRGDGDHAVDEAQREEGEPRVADFHQALAAQVIGQADEAGRREHEEQERVEIDDAQMQRRVGEQRDEKIERVPDEKRRVAQHVVMAAEKMIRDEGRVAVEQVIAQFHEERVASVEIVVGQEEERPPDFEDEKDQRRVEEVAPQQRGERRERGCGLIHDARSRGG